MEKEKFIRRMLDKIKANEMAIKSHSHDYKYKKSQRIRLIDACEMRIETYLECINIIKKNK